MAGGASSPAPPRKNAVPFMRSLWPVVFAALAVLVASNFDMTTDYMMEDMGITECVLPNGTAVAFGLTQKPKTPTCGWRAAGFQASKATLISVLCANAMHGLERNVAGLAVAGGGQTTAGVAKALYMWVGWMWKGVVNNIT